MQQLTFNILVMPYEDKYMALCKEAGIVRAGDSLEAARAAIFSAMKTLVAAVHANPKLQPSLTVGLPLHYRFLFNWTVFKLFTRLCTRAMVKKFLYQTEPLQAFGSQFSSA